MRIRHLCCLFLVLLFAHPAFAEPLDLANNVGAAFSLRKLRASYTGSAIMVRRSSEIPPERSGLIVTATWILQR